MSSEDFFYGSSIILKRDFTPVEISFKADFWDNIKANLL